MFAHLHLPLPSSLLLSLLFISKISSLQNVPLSPHFHPLRSGTSSRSLLVPISLFLAPGLREAVERTEGNRVCSWCGSMMRMEECEGIKEDKKINGSSIGWLKI
jgi:hypothetical protein